MARNTDPNKVIVVWSNVAVVILMKFPKLVLEHQWMVHVLQQQAW